MVIYQTCANVGIVVNDRNVKFLKMFCGTNSAQHQQLRTLNGTGTENHFTIALDRLHSIAENGASREISPKKDLKTDQNNHTDH
jgi:hypothetical protein